MLKTINVLPEQLIELADMPIEAVNAAIADGRAREGVRDLAGWVVKLLRNHRNYGWKIAPPPPRADSPEALREAFARYAAEQALEQASGSDKQPSCEQAVPSNSPARPDLVRLWNDVQAVLRLQLPRQEFATWIRPVVLGAVEEGVATLIVPDARIKAAVEGRYLTSLCELLAQHVGAVVHVRIILAGAQRYTDQGEASRQRVLPEPACASAPAALGNDRATDADQRPQWISADHWLALPPIVRAALLNSRLVDGVVQAKSPHLIRLLETRYARELGELRAAAQLLDRRPESVS